MSESSSGGNNRQICLIIVLQRCIGSKKSLVMNLVQQMVVVGKDVKLEWIDLVKRGEMNQVLDDIVKHTASGEPGITSFPQYLEAVDAPKTVIELISSIINEDAPEICFALVRSWQILLQQHEAIKQNVSHTFPENEKEIVEDWPLNFIKFCSDRIKRHEVHDLLHGVGLHNTSQAVSAQEPSPQQASDRETLPSGKPEITGKEDVTDVALFKEKEKYQEQDMEIDPMPENIQTMSPESAVQQQDYIPSSYQVNPGEGFPCGRSQTQPSHPMDLGENQEYDFRFYQDCHVATPSYLALDFKYEDVSDEFFGEKYEEICSSRDILLPAVKLMWTQIEKLTQLETWPNEIMQAVSDLDNRALVRNLACVFKWLLDLKNIYPNITPAAIMARHDLRDWISNNVPRFSETEKGTTIFKVLLAIAWPGMESAQPVAWKAFLLSTESENDRNKLSTFVSLLQTLTGPEPFGISTIPLESRSEPSAPANVEDFIGENYDAIRSSRKILVPVVELLWPGNDKLIKLETWPRDIMQTVSDSDNKSLIRNLACVFKCLLDMKKNSPNITLVPELKTPGIEDWISSQVNDEIIQQSTIFRALLAIAWPGVEENHPTSWRQFLLDKCKNDDRKVATFVSILHTMMPQTFKVAQGVITESRESDETQAFKNTEHETAKGRFGKDSATFDEPRTLLLPIVGIVWPGQKHLTEKDGWPLRLILTVTGEKNPSLIQKFKKLRDWFVKMKKNAPDYDLKELMTPEKARKWILLGPPEINKLDGKAILDTLFEHTWPDAGEKPDDWRKFLLRQYKFDADKATNFANAVDVALQLCEASSQFKDSQKLRNVQELTGDEEAINSHYDEIASCRDVLTPFVKLLLPEDVDVLEERHWPADLLVKLTDGKSSITCHNFAEICGRIIPMLKASQEFHPNGSFSSHEARGWMMRVHNKLGKSDEGISVFNMLYQITWLETKEPPLKKDWTINLLRKYKKDEAKSTNFANAAEIMFRLLKAPIGTEKEATEASDSGVDIFNDIYEEIEVSRHILSPVVRLAWPDHTTITEEKTWPEEFVARCVNSKKSKKAIQIAELSRDLVDMRQAAPDYTPATLEDVNAWIMKGPKTFQTSQKEILFKQLLKIAWPTTKVEDSKWVLFLYKQKKEDKANFINFANAGAAVQGLIEASLQSGHAQGKKRRNDKTKTSADKEMQYKTKGVTQKTPNPPTPQTSNMQTRSQKYNTATACTETSNQMELWRKPSTATHTPSHRMDVPPHIVMHRDASHPGTATLIKKEQSDGTETFGLGEPPIPVPGEVRYQSQHDRKDAALNKTFEDWNRTTISIKRSQFEGHATVIRVVVLGNSTEETAYVDINNEVRPLSHLGIPDSPLYTVTVLQNGKYTYRYCLHNGQTGSYRYEDHVRTIDLTCKQYIFDVVCFDQSFGPQSIEDTWGQKMIMHLPLRDDELLQSNLLSTEVSCWLEQMHIGWTTSEGVLRPKKETTNKVILDWLRSLIKQDKVMASLVMLAIRELRFELTEEMAKELCIGMRIYDMAIDEQDQLYIHILNVFVSKSTDAHSVAQRILGLTRFVADPSWLLALPLVYMLSDKSAPSVSKYRDMKDKLPFLPAKESTFEEIALGWQEWAAQHNEKDFEKSLDDLLPSILDVAKTHPWIILVYQYILKPDAITNLMATDNEVVTGFELCGLLKVITAHLDSLAKSKESKESTKILETTTLHFRKMFEQCASDDFVRSFTEDELTSTMESMHEMLATIANKLKRADSYSNQYILFWLNLCDLISKWPFQLCKQNSKFSADRTKEHLRHILGNVLYTVNPDQIAQISGIKFCDHLISCTWHADFRTEWVDTIRNTVVSTIDEAWDKEDKYFEFYINTVVSTHLSRDLEDCFEEKAVRCAEVMLDREGSKKLGRLEKLFHKSKVRISFSEKLFLRRCQKYRISAKQVDTTTVLNFVCEWPIAAKFFEKYNNKESLRHFSKAKDTIVKIAEVSTAFVQALANKTVLTDEMNVIEGHIPKICEFLQLFSQDVMGSTASSLERIISDLQQRKRLFQEERRRFKMFFHMCKKRTDVEMADCQKIKELYDRAHQSKRISDQFTSEEIAAEPHKFRGLTKNDMEEMMMMDGIGDSRVFEKLWVEVFDNYKDMSAPSEHPLLIEWKIVIGEIWTAVKKEICNLVEALSQESIELQEVIRRFAFTNGNQRSIQTELSKLSKFYRKAATVVAKDMEDEEGLHQIVKRIHDVFEIKRNSKGLKWALNYRKKFMLQGDFRELERTVNIEEDMNLALREIDKKTLQRFPEELRKITSEKLDILQNFLRQDYLISWIQSLKMTEIDEVNVMCDLARASAGETPLDTDRWMWLQSAAQAFAPLLFHVDEIQSLPELLERCDEVWRNVEQDDKVLERWNESGSNLKWLSEKESVHGSQQKRSLKLAQSINERGVYTVGKQTKECPTLDNSISLSLREDTPPRRHGGGQKEQKPYDLHMLQDLQSKLALIAGKDDQGKPDISQFVDVFTSVKTLGESFINLVHAGCMLFNDWTAVIASAPCTAADRQNENNLTLTMQFTKNGKPFSGIASLSLLNDLSKTLREVYRQWTEYISNKRLQHYFLNEYNMQQITFLCNQLANPRNVALLPDQVIALLCKSSKLLSPDVIGDALDRAIRIEDQQETTDDQETQSREQINDMSELEKKNRSIRMLVSRDRDISEDLAKAAVQAVGYENLDECSNWVLLHQYDHELLKENLQKYNDENAYAHGRNEEEELVDILHNRAVNSLTEMIDQILETTPVGDSVKLVGAVKTICTRYYERTSVLTMQDYLSVDHLGKFLTNLHEGGEVNPAVHRILPEPLEQGKPNLIVCHDDETLRIVLSMYMHNPEQALPSSSEVLLCSEETTVDDVERFMRRAMRKCEHNGERLFCMGFAEKLNFKVSQAIEDFFETLSHQDQYIDQKYQMVIICSNQQHYITECFDKNQVQRWPKYSRQKICDYLNQHLYSDKTTHNEFGASNVKVVASNRSCVGKSLHVKKLSDLLSKRWCDDCQIKHMSSLLELLKHVEGYGSLSGRSLPAPLVSGKPNLIHCPESEILPVLLALYMQDEKKSPPTAAEILLCSQQTSEEEIERFMRRAMCNLDRGTSLFAIAYGERLTPVVANHVRMLSETLSRNMHCRNNYQLVIISSGISPFAWCQKKFKVGDDSNHNDPQKIKAYLMRKQVNGSTTLILTEISPGEVNGETVPATPDPPQQWQRTTVRLLEKCIDCNHVLRELYRHEDVRNEDHHFIHIDLTPAVEDGIERFMFNLLILGTIQDDKGVVWNRQNQHLYVIEMTASALNQAQISENSILSMLPRINCKSPKESLEKLRTIRSRTMGILQQHTQQLVQTTNQEMLTLANYIKGATKFSMESFRYHEGSLDQMGDPLSRLLYFAGIPSSIILSVKLVLPETIRNQLLQIYYQEDLQSLVLMDYEEFISTNFQRPYQYLKYGSDRRDTESITRQDLNLDNFQYCQPMGSPEDCIDTLLQTGTVGVNPSWAQLRHFASFLNLQLRNCEESQFCQKISITKKKEARVARRFTWEDTEELKGLKSFAVRFMIRMSQDFATPSLDIADQSRKDVAEELIQIHRIRRKWEGKCHPYVFFNEDRTTMSFINVDLNERGHLLDEGGNVLEKNIARPELVRGLQTQGVSFGFKFHGLSRTDKLNTLRTVMGLPDTRKDPDPTYELTTDNVLKILAIYMRMRCDIPVILMGETGCGKTRLVEFMSKLQCQGNKEIRNMVTLKIHGGVNTDDIYASVEKANNLAEENAKNNMDTVLFYDEANTTNAIHAIKEVLCDGTVNGKSFRRSHLKIVAACNPYKRLSDKAIKTLEKSGLGYRVSSSETANRSGTIPMRQLVYKVVALPPSIQPFVWDFGELSIEAEGKYICQMTSHLRISLSLSADDKKLIDFLFCSAQSFMKKEMKDECRYVSLRDVERCMKFFEFFHRQSKFLFPKIQTRLGEMYGSGRQPPDISQTLRCLIQTLGVCYHVSLHERKKFREHLSQRLKKKKFLMDERDIEREIVACQEVFLGYVKMETDIAPNEALRENVYLITICAELRIPLFLVGKPGSSKSLARTIVAANMDGKRSKGALYKRLKQAKMTTYQCSAITDAKGIQTIFKQCSEQQKNQDITAVVVLDEIGLAEDSPNMPLKILHPLLECGRLTSGTIAETKPEEKVGFVGISNWALDPAKMNRGIFVTRSTPTKDDLLETAAGIVKKTFRILGDEIEVLRKLTEAYLQIYNGQIQTVSKEYFGLRDYYSLIKMVNAKSTNETKCEIKDIAYAVQRNFGGGVQSHFETFMRTVEDQYADNIPEKIPVQDMIRHNLTEQDTRFVMLLTEQHASVALLEHIIPQFRERVQVIYGSSFPGDHNFTEICNNISRIKLCMESGGVVVLLDMTEIHESLYDALNQHYAKYGGQRYVDIGLGGNRVKCRIADSFRLIVVEQKDIVYMDYPIPLVNRLEKHHLNSGNLLTPAQKEQAAQLDKWAKTFSKSTAGTFVEKDAFMGYHSDSASSLVLSQRKDVSIETCKGILLQTAAADAMFRASQNPMLAGKDRLLTIYTQQQVHDSLVNLLDDKMKHDKGKLSVMEITSFSNILTEKDRRKIGKSLKLDQISIMLLSLQQFDTQQEYVSRLDTFFSDTRDLSNDGVKVLLIQCPQAQKHGPLLACAKFCVTNKLRDIMVERRPGTIIIAFLLSTQRQHSDDRDTKHQLILQHGTTSEIIYVDDLRPAGAGNTVVSQFYNKSLTEVLRLGERELSSPENIAENSINFTGLLKDSICQSMANVKRNNKTVYRNLKCIQLLTRLCSQAEGIGKEFRYVLIQNMIKIFTDRDKDVAGVMVSWIAKEANSAKNLQEGGTFGKTLCLCIKRHLADLLAFVVGTVDENNNLDFLLVDDGCSWKQDLWLKFFTSYKMEWSSMKGLREFPVRILPHLGSDFSPRLPFSYVLNGIFAMQWDMLQAENESTKTRMFFKQFQKMPEAQILSKVCSNGHTEEIVGSYASDVLRCLSDFNKIGDDGQECLTRVLLAITDILKEKLMQEGVFRKGDDLTTIYFSYKQYSKHLHMLHDIFHVCPELLLQADEWIEQQQKTKELIVHTMAMKSMLDWIGSYNIKDEKTCVEWMNLTSKCKTIFHSWKDLIRHPNHKEEIAKKWQPISLLDLLLLQLLPSAGSDSFTKYVEVVVSHAKRLLNPLKTMGFRNKDFLRIVLNVLRRSYEDIRLRLLVDWETPTCGMCRRLLANPVRLPCNHLICGGCTDRILAAAEVRRQCPKCPTHISKEFERPLAELSLEQETQAAGFKSNCTSFFLQYLTQFCFSITDSEMEGQAQLFLYELVARVSKNGGKMELETLAVDLNIATRSIVFKLLTEHYGYLVHREIDELLSSDKLSEAQMEDLVVVILHGYESNLHDEKGWHAFHETWRLLKKHSEPITIGTLKAASYIRHVLLKHLNGFGPNGTVLDPDHLAVIEMCVEDETDTLSQFIVKSGCQLFGTGWFAFIHSHKRLKDLVPRYLNDAVNDTKVDYWLILGEKYRIVREKLLHAISYENYKRQLTIWINEKQEILGRLSAILAIAWHGEPHHINYLERQLGRRKALLRLFKLLNQRIAGVGTNKSKLLNQLIIFTGCALMFQPDMMENYFHLATNPAGVAGLFWPGMPESLYFSIRDMFGAGTGIATYTCPQGHPYVIGECTRPVEEAECPECGEIIGGRHHQSAVGNQRIERPEASEAGYQLLTDKKGKDDPNDRMSKQGVAVIHFITHCSMLIALEQDPNTICRVLGRYHNKETAKNYLYKGIQNNITDLSQALGRNYDDAVIVIFCCVSNLITDGCDPCRRDTEVADVVGRMGRTTWETMSGRRSWEKRFRNRYLLPIFKNLDNVLIEAQNRINTVEKLHEMMLHRTVHEITHEGEKGSLSWRHPMLWKFIKHSNAPHLLQTVGDSQTKGVLNVILESPDLHRLQHLENVLKLQNVLITRYQNKKDMKQVDEISFDKYMDENDGHRNRKLIEEYINLWNSIYEVFRLHADKQVRQYLEEISVKSPISMALPSSRGRGRCAKMIAEYLIDIHNNFLHNCSEAIKTPEGPEVDVRQLLEANFICIDKQKDLLPLISMHTAYHATIDETGRHHHITYNIEALEKQVRENYVIYQPRIDKKSLPCITYPQDIGIGSDWKRTKENIEQVPLTNKIVQELDGLVTNQDTTPADVCDGVRTLTHAISFLAKIEADATKPIHAYLEESLMLSPNHMAMIPRSALVCHTLALYQRLMWHKAVNFVEQGLDPYHEALYNVDQEEISDPDVLQGLKDAFEHMDMNLFQQRLNEIMIQAPDHNRNWSLKEEIFPFTEFLEGNDEAWFERIPSGICFKHISHLFRLAVRGVVFPNTIQ